MLALAGTGHADLYATRGGSIGAPTGVLRFSEVTGAFLNQNPYPPGFVAEDFHGVEVAPNRDVFALDNTLGYISAHRFAPNLAYLGNFGPAHAPGVPNLYFQHAGLTVDAQNNLYAASLLKPSLFSPDPGVPGIFKLDAATGQLTGAMPFASAPGMTDPYDLQFGPNGHLFVSDRGLGVLEFDNLTGAYVRTVVASSPGMLEQVTGIGFGPNGQLLVASAATSSILRYDLATATLDVFIPPGSGGLMSPADIDFGPDGNVYVADRGSHTVLRYRGTDGSPLGEFTIGGANLFDSAGPEFLSFPPVPEVATFFPVVAALLPAGLWLIRRRSANSRGSGTAEESRNPDLPIR